MSSRVSQHIFPLGLVLFALGLNVYKTLMLTAEIDAGWRTFLYLLGLDLFFISLLWLIAILMGLAKTGWLQRCLWLGLVLLVGVYLVDSFVLLALDDHAVLFDIGRYTPEWGVVLSFFDARVYTAILAFLASVFLVCGFTLHRKKFPLLFLPVLLIGGTVNAVTSPQPLLRYAFVNPAELLSRVSPQQAITAYSIEQMEFYAGLAREPVFVPDAKPNIILLVVESLSSINSMKVSGSGNLLAGFDQLATEGYLFKNFFANHQASEGGIISLLSGFPPMHFPTATPYMFDEFAKQHSVLAHYRKAGYFTEFLTNSDLSFIGLNHYLEGLGFDRSRGRDEVDAMRLAPRIVQDAPADNFLYAQALATLRLRAASHQTLLLVLATSSTHLPMTHPLEGPDSAERVWSWSLQQLNQFYQGLMEQGYFEHGILLVTGDHRQMRPVSETETRVYGDSARARVPLLVIGNGWPRGVSDERFFQQSDLLRMLGKANNLNLELSAQTIWVERYNRKYGRVENIDKLSVFDQADGGQKEYPIRVSGNQIEWLREKPVFARRVETRIHMQRSLHQKMRNGVTKP